MEWSCLFIHFRLYRNIFHFLFLLCDNQITIQREMLLQRAFYKVDGSLLLKYELALYEENHFHQRYEITGRARRSFVKLLNENEAHSNNYESREKRKIHGKITIRIKCS